VTPTSALSRAILQNFKKQQLEIKNRPTLTADKIPIVTLLACNIGSASRAMAV
jgi:hypothetical protein